jgi:hypothetical protein
MSGGKSSPITWLALAMLATVPAASADDAASASQKRQVPDYDGRGGEPPTAAEEALWVPRVLLSPAYAVGEYALREPLGAATVWADHQHIPRTLYDFFTFGPDHQAGIAPIAFLDMGSNPDVGLYAFWNDAGVKGHSLRAHAEVWNSQWLAASLTDTLRIKDGGVVTLKGSAERRPDHAFYGLGPQTLNDDVSRYGEDRVDGSLHVSLLGWRSSRVTLGAGVRRERIYDGHFGADPGTFEAAAAGTYALPVGFGDAFTAYYCDVALVLDSRPSGSALASGARGELDVEEGFQPQGAYGWERWNATAGVFYDVNGRGRVLSLSVATSAVNAPGNSAIPFTEMVSLGGNDAMRGFYVGRLVDRSGAVATLRYRWPVWMWLNGTVEGAVGNVFPDYLKGLSPSLLRASAAVGVETPPSSEGAFMFLVGFGTETFAQGARVDSLRVVLGTNHGF